MKPDLVVAVIGHRWHGKTTAAAALATTSGNETGADELQLAGHRPALAVVDTEPARVFLEDAPGWRTNIKNTARALSAADAALLVVNARDGVDAQTREHLLLARGLGVDQVVVLLSHCDQVADLDLLDTAEAEARGVLVDAGLDGDDVRFVRGSAERALVREPLWVESMHRLGRALGELSARPPRPGPLRLDVYQVCRARDARAWVVQGRLEGEALAVGEVVELVGLGRDPQRARVDRVEVGRAPVERAEPGQLVGVQLNLPSYPRPRPGLALGRPGKLTTTRVLKARVKLFDDARPTPVHTGYRPRLFCGPAAVPARFELQGIAALAPGAEAEVLVELDREVPAPARFAVVDGSTRYAEVEGQQVPLHAGVVGYGELSSA